MLICMALSGRLGPVRNGSLADCVSARSSPDAAFAFGVTGQARIFLACAGEQIGVLSLRSGSPRPQPIAGPGRPERPARTDCDSSTVSGSVFTEPRRQLHTSAPEPSPIGVRPVLSGL